MNSFKSQEGLNKQLQERVNKLQQELAKRDHEKESLSSSLNQQENNNVALKAQMQSVAAQKQEEFWEIDKKDLFLVREFNRGSYGAIYKGFWRNALVAVKKLHISQATSAMGEFREEIIKLSKLRPHPNIVQFLGGSLKDPILMVTELVEGGDLLTKITEKKPLKPDRVHRILKGISAGMFHLHSEGIVHRDLAARNILLSSKDHVKISDFGYARFIGTDEAKHTVQNEGPLRWMAPGILYRSKDFFLCHDFP
eukprot:TRINITY_DN1036_c0_g2_i2.p1 TRINITY_DN1036_c0_g2~~TRINITY_DN1036_c0_g2_i2.p1  ORF type:complete len:253 (-),score=42.83 TRINITY_DN1036_c0_g2_i2:367-1125(-)